MKPEKKTEQIRGRYSKSVLARYKDFVAQGEFKHDEDALVTLLNAYERPLPSSLVPPALTLDDLFAALPLTSNEHEEIRLALSHDYMALSITELLVTGILSQARRANSHAVSNELAARGELPEPANERLSTRGGSTRRGSGFRAVETYVHERMAANLAASMWYDRLYLTEQQVHQNTGVNRQDVRKYFDVRAAELDAHHTAIGFATREEGIAHNRKVSHYHRSRAAQA